ncbi:MAG: hypothetical protein RIQ94_2314 [Pseudomonadota bacterium]|jgi:mRNA-degrading endonuclease RelE of RelBE toxin-antitoxin system
MIHIHDDATEDLKKILHANRDDAIKLLAFIEQLKADSNLIKKLLEHGFGDDKSELISVKKWLSVHKIERQPVWRLRAWNLEQQGLKYRLIYLFNWHDKSHYIMAIIHRGDFDYDDPNDPIRKRITQRIRTEFPTI